VLTILINISHRQSTMKIVTSIDHEGGFLICGFTCDILTDCSCSNAKGTAAAISPRVGLEATCDETLDLVRGVCAMGQRQAQRISRNVLLHILLITDDQYTCLQQNRLVQARSCKQRSAAVAVRLCQFKSCSFSDKIPSYSNRKYSRAMPSI